MMMIMMMLRLHVMMMMMLRLHVLVMDHLRFLLRCVAGARMIHFVSDVDWLFYVKPGQPRAF